MPQPYRLWTFRTSPFAGKARAAFAEKDVAVELVEIHPVRRPPQLRELNPLNRVPVLELDGVAVRDSALICEWLEEVHPEPALWPADAARRAWARGWAKWLDEGPVRSFFLGMRKLAFGMAPGDPEDVVERLLDRVPEQWPVLEQALGVHAGPWLVGDQFTHADLAGMALAVRLPQWRPDLQPAEDAHPRAAAWLAALRERPSAAAIDAAGAERLSARAPGPGRRLGLSQRGAQALGALGDVGVRDGERQPGPARAAPHGGAPRPADAAGRGLAGCARGRRRPLPAPRPRHSRPRRPRCAPRPRRVPRPPRPRRARRGALTMADARALAALRSLGETALRLGRDTTSARLALAHLHAVVDPAALPPDVRGPIVRQLDAAAAAAAVPLAFKEVEKVLRDAWRAKPTATLDALDRDPVAVTPGAQVHRGVLDGRPVAVKVIRPGIPEVIRSDLGLADALLRPLGAAFPRIDPAALVAEARERILDELDLEHEGATQRSFHRALRRHPALHVPAVHGALTHERVLVSDWVDGRPVLEATADEAPAVVRALVAFHVGGARVGTVHADPHPGNALLLDDGRVAFLDFGAARRVEAARTDGAVAALDALAARDGASLGAALHGLGWLPADAGPEADALAREVFGGLLDGPAALDAAALLGIGERLEARTQQIAALAARTSVPPADLWPLRMLGGLFALCARLGVTEDWTALVRTAARDGW